MSRVYEALRQSEIEAGSTASMLDPDSFLSHPVVVPEPTAEPSLEEGTFAWDEVTEFHPAPLPDSRLVALTDDNSLAAEKFRLLRARLRHLRETQRVRRIVITSAVPNEGKTLVSMNLAVTLAKHTTEKVLLLEGDLRKPMLAQHLRIPDSRGLDDWFASNEPITKFLRHFDGLQLWLLSAGTPRDNPVNILQSARFLELYKQLSNCFDWVLIDAPPLLPMADVNFWSRQADGLLLVCREAQTPKTVLKKGLEVLDSPKLLGVVINDAHAVESSYYHHYYDKQASRTRAIPKPDEIK